ncbi:hypothetical protein K439DRAFT_1616022 [Ramaria rubella]|nr:hypothetical protein K439DRAFT_1616022 [Ramaria rubella]
MPEFFPAGAPRNEGRERVSSPSSKDSETSSAYDDVHCQKYGEHDPGPEAEEDDEQANGHREASLPDGREQLGDQADEWDLGHEYMGASDELGYEDGNICSDISAESADGDVSDSNCGSQGDHEGDSPGSKHEGDSDRSCPPSPREVLWQRIYELSVMDDGFVLVVPELRTSMEFIWALEAATLDNGDIKGDAL